MMSEYQNIIVETYLCKQESRRHGQVHVRPISGQPYPTTMNVECTKSIKKMHLVGKRYRIRVKKTHREGGKPFLFSHHSWLPEPVT